MDTRWLQDFLALAECGNFTQAAHRRAISQAAFSRRIQSLERWLGVTLVHRGTVPIHLTPDGLRFEGEAKSILDTLLSTRTTFSVNQKTPSLPVQIAMSHVIASYRFAPWWSEWNKDTPLIASTLIGNINEVVSGFITGNSDVLICHRAESLPIMIDSRHVISHVLGTEKLIPCIAKNAGMVPGNSDKGKLESMPLIMYRTGAYFGGLLENLLEQSPMQLLGNRVIESEMSNVVAAFIAHGLGLGWVPECVLHSSNGKNIVAVDEPALCMDLEVVAFTKKNKRSFAADILWRSITE